MVVKKPEKSVTAYEDLFELVCEAHICTAAMQAFQYPGMTHHPVLTF